jgi:hypothetical protein
MKYNDQGMKWLRIRNWKKYQPDGKLRNKEARLPWVRDYTEKLENYDYVKLTFFQRALFEGLCLIAATKPSRSIHNDPTYISRALHAPVTDIPHIGHGLSTLISRGYIIPTNTEKFFEDEDEFAVGERDREGEGDGEGLSASQSVSYEEADASMGQFELVDTEISVNKLPCFAPLHEQFGCDEQLPEETIRRVHSALRILEKDELWMQGCIQYALNHKWWKKCVFNAKSFGDRLIAGVNDPDSKKLPAQYNQYAAVRRRSAGAGK